MSSALIGLIGLAWVIVSVAFGKWICPRLFRHASDK